MSNLIDFFHKYHQIKYAKNNTIVSAFDTPQGIYYLEAGYVRMYSIFSDGRELTLNIFKPGTYFPMIWAITDQENAYYFMTMTAAVLWRAPKQDVLDYLKNNPTELMDLTKRVLSGMNGILNNPENMLYGDAYARVKSAFHMCAVRFGQRSGNGAVVINLRLTHRDVGGLCGLTRETVTKEIQKLLKEKIISLNNRYFVVHDMSKLVTN